MADNKKPRICEVLGVEVNQEWIVDSTDWDYNKIVNHINERGEHEWKTSDEDWEVAGWEIMLVFAINHPELIKACSRWTKQDIEDAKAIKRLFPGIETVHRGGYNCSGLYIHDNCHYKLNDSLFPDLKEGETITLDEIIGGEKSD